MSVIVKGMEMPTTCCNCKFRELFLVFAYCHLAEMDMEYEESENCRHPDCPLVEIPTPHGRLIDADKLANETFYGATSAPYITYRKFVNAPTVIEAEGREE